MFADDGDEDDRGESVLFSDFDELPDEPEPVSEKPTAETDPEATVVKPPQLAPHDLELPEEPEEVEIVSRVWNQETQTFAYVSAGKRLLVPTGCKRPEYLNPYETKVKLKSALPRDRERDANLYAQYQQNGWVSRRWIQERIEDEINIPQVDREISEDVPFLLALQGKVDVSGVGQTSGPQGTTTSVPNAAGVPGSSNGAPPPPGPGPGRGNKFAPGDNLGGPKVPSNGTPGTPV